MTTEAPRTRTAAGGHILVGAAGSVVLIGAAFVALAGLIDGGSALAGAAVGIALALVFFVFGTAAVNAVARIMPQASVLFALLTYALQVVLVAVVFIVLNSSGALDEQLDARWLGGGVILATLTWMVAQITFFRRARIPVFEAAAR